MLLVWDLSYSNPKFANLIVNKNERKERQGKNKNKTTRKGIIKADVAMNKGLLFARDNLGVTVKLRPKSALTWVRI